jgi:hypothetical protein
MTTSFAVKKLSKSGMVLAVITTIGLSTSAASAANVVLLNDNFNTVNSGNPLLNYNGFTNWDVTNGTVDLIGNGSFDFLPGNGLYIDTDGSSNNAGILSSKNAFAFATGDIVDLTFKLAGNQRNNGLDSVLISLGSLFSETFTLPSNQGFTTFNRSFTVASATNAKLAFEGIGGDNVGLLLDDVKLIKSANEPASVPEPASLIGILGLGAFGVTSLRKRKQATAVKA